MEQIFLALRKNKPGTLCLSGEDVRGKFITDLHTMAAHLADGWSVFEMGNLKPITHIKMLINPESKNANDQPTQPTEPNNQCGR